MLAREGKGLVRMAQVLDERKQDWPSLITTLVQRGWNNKDLKRGGKRTARQQRKVKSSVHPNQRAVERTRISGGKGN